ncbi:F-box only protein 27-like isoform X1 [Anolis sagrei]|uniref:F-box only protein 27-like isoform X1 n=1 Tax=Anolis sagrei TaxID=38937 RepID=UPI00352299E8
MSRRRKRKMGLVKSKSASPMATEDIQIMEDLKYLPDELLLLILSWVPGRSLVRECRLVCRKWRDLIDKPTLWRLKCQRDPLSKAAVEAVQGASQIDWRRISILRPFGRNLIKNPCGKKQFQHWEIENGGDGWKVEGNRDRVEGAEAQTCFVSSYGWCVKSQVVDLLQEGLGEELMDAFQPDICIADWWGARDDCGCIYKIEVHLLAADRTSVISSFTAKPDGIPQWNNAKYQQVSHVFRKYGPGVRYIHFRHAGKDTQFWAGHYGARITNSTVKVKFSSKPLGASTPSH